jgi:hypothetical protein
MGGYRNKDELQQARTKQQAAQPKQAMLTTKPKKQTRTKRIEKGIPALASKYL